MLISVKLFTCAVKNCGKSAATKGAVVNKSKCKDKHGHKIRFQDSIPPSWGRPHGTKKLYFVARKEVWGWPTKVTVVREVVTPTGSLRGPSGDSLRPVVIDRPGIAEIHERAPISAGSASVPDEPEISLKSPVRERV